MFFKRFIQFDELDQLVQVSTQHLLDEYREIDGLCGWHQQLGSPKIGNIANAQALLILKYFERHFPKKHLVVDSLKQTQFANNTEIASIGGWSYVTNFSQRPTTECTAWVLLALFGELPPEDKVIRSALHWLLANKANAVGDTGWASIKEQNARVYATSLALRVLSKYNKHQTFEFKSAVAWLKSIQNADGGWGEQPQASSTVTHTSHAVLALLDSGLDPSSPRISNAVKWLKKILANNEGWLTAEHSGLSETVEYNENGTFQRVTFYHYSLPWALTCLLKTRNGKSFEAYQGFKFLVGKAVDGNWVHPFLAGIPYHTIWSKHDVLLALYTLSNASDKDRAQGRIEFQAKTQVRPWKLSGSPTIAKTWKLLTLLGAIVVGLATVVSALNDSLDIPSKFGYESWREVIGLEKNQEDFNDGLILLQDKFQITADGLGLNKTIESTIIVKGNEETLTLLDTILIERFFLTNKEYFLHDSAAEIAPMVEIIDYSFTQLKLEQNEQCKVKLIFGYSIIPTIKVSSLEDNYIYNVGAIKLKFLYKKENQIKDAFVTLRVQLLKK